MAIDFSPVAFKVAINGTVDVNSSTVTAVRVGSSNMSERKWLLIQVACGGTTKIFLGAQTADLAEPTAAQLAKRGIKFGDGDRVWFPVADGITIYAVSSSGAGKRLRVMELA